MAGHMDELARKAVDERNRRRAQWVSEGWVTRAEAQRMLGLSRAWVDALRRTGVLSWERNDHTGAVRVSRASVEAEARRRAGG